MKFINKKLREISGVTLVEVLIVAGLMAGLAVVMMNMTKQQTVIQKKAESSFEVSTLHSGIVSTLLTAEACTHTLAPVGDIRAATSLTEIRNRNNAVLYNTTTNYNNLVRLNSLRLKGLILAPMAAGKAFGDLILEVTYEKTASILPGQAKTTVSEIALRIQVDSSYVVTNCYSATENAIDESKKQSCEAINGTFNVATQKCDLTPFVSPIVPNISSAVSTKHLEDFLLLHLDPRYVETNGDTMVGTLNMTSGARIDISGPGELRLLAANLVANNASWNLTSNPVTLNSSQLNLNNSHLVMSGNGNLTQTGSGYIYSTNYISVSDKRLKKNFKTLENISPKIYDLKSYQFFWRRNNNKDYGFIAQEVEELFPELVQNNKETGYKGVRYVSLIPLMIEEMKKLKQENADLRRDIEEIRDYLKLKKVE